MEDVMDCGTIEDCTALFHYITQRAARRAIPPRQGLLKVCNQLVKRLSKVRIRSGQQG